MAVLMQARVHGLSEEQYEDLTRGSFIDRLRSSEGYIGLHAGGPIDDGIQVFGLWETTADHERWVEREVVPNVPAEAIAQMEVTYHPLHTAIT